MSNNLDKVKIVMLKGEKGEKGDGSYDDTEIRGLITAEAQERASTDSGLEMRKADKTQVATVAETLGDGINVARNEINTLSNRMDTFSSLPSGSTSGNAELVDIRVGADGKTYSTAGNAVRGQLSNITETTRNLLDINNWVSSNNSMKVVGGVASNLLADTRASLALYIRTKNNGSTVETVYSGPETVRRKVIQFTAGADANGIQFYVSGSTQDIYINFPLNIVAGEQYTLSFNITGANPNVVGGFSFENVQLERGANATKYIEHQSAVDNILREQAETYFEELDSIVDEFNLFDVSNLTIIQGVVTNSTISTSGSGKVCFLELEGSVKYALFRGITDNRNFTLGFADNNQLYANVVGRKTIKFGQTYIEQEYDVNPYVFTVPTGYPYLAIEYYPDSNYTEDEVLNSIQLFKYKAVANIAEMSTKLNRIVNPMEELFADEVKAVIDEAKSKMTSKAIVLGVITDTHVDADRDIYYMRSTQNMKKVNETLSFDLCVHLGDIIDGGESKETEKEFLSYCINHLLSIGAKKTLALVGNHDANWLNADSEQWLSEGELYGQIQRFNETDVIRDGVSSNYYCDYDHLKIRVICVDSCYNAQGFSNETITWITNILSSAPNDYSFVILSHEPTRGSLISQHSSESYNSAEFEAVLAQYQSRICGYIHGHTHFDNVSYVNGYPEISITCGQPFAYPTTNIPSGATVPERTIGSVSQDAWDIIVVLPEENKFELVRFGAGNSRTIPFVQS